MILLVDYFEVLRFLTYGLENPLIILNNALSQANCQEYLVLP